MKGFRHVRIAWLFALAIVSGSCHCLRRSYDRPVAEQRVAVFTGRESRRTSISCNSAQRRFFSVSLKPGAQAPRWRMA